MKDEDLAGLLVLILVGAVLLWIYVVQPVIAWISQNWIPLTIGFIVVVIGGIVFYVKLWLPSEREEQKKQQKQAEETRRIIEEQERMEKSIIRKRLLKERGNELEGLALTEEEREFQLNRWVEEEYKKKYEETSEAEYAEEEYEVEKVPPLSASEKERLIREVGTRCCYPNCRESIALEVHHIIPRAEGGINKENNLIVLCSIHHTLAQSGAIPRERLKQHSVAKIKRRRKQFAPF